MCSRSVSLWTKHVWTPADSNFSHPRSVDSVDNDQTPLDHPDNCETFFFSWTRFIETAKNRGKPDFLSVGFEPEQLLVLTPVCYHYTTLARRNSPLKTSLYHFRHKNDLLIERTLWNNLPLVLHWSSFYGNLPMRQLWNFFPSVG